jgi:hypothetical protein
MASLLPANSAGTSGPRLKRRIESICLFFLKTVMICCGPGSDLGKVLVPVPARVPDPGNI